MEANACIALDKFHGISRKLCERQPVGQAKHLFRKCGAQIAPRASAFKAQAESHAADMRELERKLAALAEARGELESRLGRADEEARSLGAKVQDLERRSAALDEARAGLEKQKTGLEQALARSQGELQAVNQAFAQEKSSLAAAMDELKARLEKAEQEGKALKAELAAPLGQQLKRVFLKKGK